MKDVIVIGGGASGLIAAIYAAKTGNKVTILEKNKTLGIDKDWPSRFLINLMDKGLVSEGSDDYYYLTVLDASEANLIEYNTLSKLMNVL